MKALRFIDGRLDVADVAEPKSGDEAVVRITLSGICNTDLEILAGYSGFEGTIGHEFVGLVESAPGRADLVGRRVVGEINAGCGTCSKCLAADPRHCATRTVLGIVNRDGCHAEKLTLPVENLLVVPDRVSDEQAVFAEPLAAAYGITESVNISEKTSVAVIGDGKLGLLCAMSLGQISSDVTLVGKHSSKIAIAVSTGVRGVLLDEIGSLTDRGSDVVVEASGSESGFATALDLVRPKGTIVLKSTFHGTPTWAASRVVVDEITVVGSRCGRFAPAIELLAKRVVPVERLITDRFRLADGVAAIERARQPGVLKVLLQP